jgi:hypothetical protein
MELYLTMDKLIKICLLITLVAAVSGNYISYPTENSNRKIVTFDDDIQFAEDGSCVPVRVPLYIVSAVLDVLVLEWTAPETCVTGFIAFVGDNVTEVPFDSSTEMYSLIYNDLERCTDYRTGVAVIGENGTIGEAVVTDIRTISPLQAGRVSNLSLEGFNDSWILSWQPQALERNCITEYHLYGRDAYDGSIVINGEVTYPYYEFKRYVACRIYTISIIPYINLFPGLEFIDFLIIPARPLEPPTLVGIGISSTSATLVVSLQPFDDNSCEILSLQTQCAIDGVGSFGFSQPFEGSRSEVNIDIAPLAADTIYSCQVSVTNGGGISGLSDVITFRTNSE